MILDSLDWDPEVDSPATVLVIGGDTVAVEAALYARFLGYAVLLAAPGRISANESELDGPLGWSEATSKLGLAALEAQGKELPSEEDTFSLQAFNERYLIPLAKTDLLADTVQINSIVKSLSRIGCLPYDQLSKEQLSSQGFRVLVDSRKRGEYSQLIDVLLDCSGFLGQPGLASGGGLAIGETAFRVHLAMIDGDDAADNKPSSGRVIVYGRSEQALRKVEVMGGQGNQVTWIIPRRYVTERGAQPRDFEQRLTDFRAQASEAVCLDAWGIESISAAESGEGGWKLRVQTQPEETMDLECDLFFAEDAGLPDWQFATQLRYPREFAEVESGLTQEPNYFVLGPKSGLAISEQGALASYRTQIQKCFALIGGRAELNLYDTVKPSS